MQIKVALPASPTRRTRVVRAAWWNVVLVTYVVLLGSASGARAQSKPAPAGAASPLGAAKTAEGAPSQAGPKAIAQAPVLKAWTGDLDGMIERRAIRAGVTYTKTHYFVDRGVQRGISYEAMKLYEDELNKSLKTGHLKVNVGFVVLSRDELIPALRQGRIDLIATPLTVTPEREAQVKFGLSTRADVSEIAVTAPGAPAPANVDDLSGREVFVRKSSSYYQSLLALNKELGAKGMKPVVIREAPENLEDEDLLEMVNAGLVKTIIMDDHVATYWKQVFTGIVLHPTVAVRTGGRLALAVRQDSPKLAASLDDFVRRNGQRTLFGNMIAKRYLQNTKYTKSATAEAEMARFKEMVGFFRKYGDRYELDWILMAAQGFQESGLDHSVRSKVGAIGVMQVMPRTGADLKVGDVTELEANIHAGVKYIRFMMDQYFKDEPMDPLNKGLFTFASYNAGPGRIRQLRREAASRGLNPNIWFNNVEQVVSEKIGRETVQYVSNIYKYYVAYKLAAEQLQARDQLKAAGTF